MAKNNLPKELYRSNRADVKFNEKEWKQLCELATEEGMTVPNFIRFLIHRDYKIKKSPNRIGELPSLI
jgi:hypothetical protein